MRHEQLHAFFKMELGEVSREAGAVPRGEGAGGAAPSEMSGPLCPPPKKV